MSSICNKEQTIQEKCANWRKKLRHSSMLRHLSHCETVM